MVSASETFDEGWDQRWDSTSLSTRDVSKCTQHSDSTHLITQHVNMTFQNSFTLWLTKFSMHCEEWEKVGVE